MPSQPVSSPPISSPSPRLVAGWPFGRSQRSGSDRLRRVVLSLGAIVLLLSGPGLQAQSQRFLLSPGNRGKVGPNTTVTPENCVTAADGSVTCDTKLENPSGDSPAKPQFNPFNQ